MIDWISAISTGLATLLSGLALVVLWLSLKDTRRMGKAQTRAYLGIIAARIIYPSKDRCVAIANTRGGRGPNPTIEIDVKNFGTTPARNFHWSASATFLWADLVKKGSVAHELENLSVRSTQRIDPRKLKERGDGESIPPETPKTYRLVYGSETPADETVALLNADENKVYYPYFLIDVYYQDIFGEEIFEQYAWVAKIRASDLGSATDMSALSLKHYNEIRLEKFRQS